MFRGGGGGGGEGGGGIAANRGKVSLLQKETGATSRQRDRWRSEASAITSRSCAFEWSQNVEGSVAGKGDAFGIKKFIEEEST